MRNERQLIFNCFIGPESHPILAFPFWQHDKLCASDGHVLIRIDKNLIDNPNLVPKFQKDRKLPETSSVIPETTLNIPLTQQKIKKAIQLADIVDEYVPCEDCRNTGTVRWEYLSLEGHHHTKEFKCPVCDGEGHLGKTGNRIPDPKQLYQIRNLFFTGETMTWLLNVMDLLETSQLTVSGENPYALLLTMPGVQILITNLLLDRNDNTKNIIKIL